MIYFDHASTSYPKPQAIIKEIEFYLQNIGVSPGRGAYKRQAQAADYVYSVRSQIAAIFHIKNPDLISFTHNATHASNIVLKGFLQENDHVLVCSYSHNSVVRPLNHLKRTRGIDFDFFQINEEGDLDLESFEKLIRYNTKLVIFNHASNVIGVRSQFEKALPITSKHNIAVMLDVTQTAGIVPLQTELLGIDFLVGSGHKTLQGPSGIGFLYAKNPDSVKTFEEGGSPANASSSLYHPEMMPEKFEAGTMNYMGIAGLYGALCHTQEHGFEKMNATCMKLTEDAWQQLSSISNIRLFGTPNIQRKVPIISFVHPNILPSVIAHFLDTEGLIAARSGLHCAPGIHRQMGTYPTGTVRISFGHLNTHDEVDSFIHSLKKIIAEKV